MSESQYSRRDRSARRLRERGGAGIVRSHKEQTADHTPTPPANGPRALGPGAENASDPIRGPLLRRVIMCSSSFGVNDVNDVNERPSGWSC